MNDKIEPESKRSIEEILSLLDPKTRAMVCRGSEVKPSPSGFLNHYDVCRLFDPEHKDWKAEHLDAPGFYARQFVTEMKIPLIKVEPGIWVVNYQAYN